MKKKTGKLKLFTELWSILHQVCEKLPQQMEAVTVSEQSSGNLKEGNILLLKQHLKPLFKW